MANNSNVTLEDFIKKYNASKKKKQKTYSQYLREIGDTSEADYAEAVNEAEKEYDRARSGYGMTGELLGRKGLNGSGYASYLDANAYSELQNSKREAEKARSDTQKKNRSSYGSYLQNEESEQNRLFGDTVDSIYKYGSDNNDAAYKLAVASGLDEESARHAVDIATALSKKEEAPEEIEKDTLSVSTRRTLLGELISRGLSGDNALAFLIACGVEEEVAEEIAEAAGKLKKSNPKFKSTDLF